MPTNAFGIAAGPPGINLQVAAVNPAQLLQTPQEFCDASLAFGIIRGDVHQ
jgi:hypothetical protein